jgi:hypothetical protein
MWKEKWLSDGVRGEETGEDMLLSASVRDGTELLDSQLLLLRANCESCGHSGSAGAILADSSEKEGRRTIDL